MRDALVLFGAFAGYALESIVLVAMVAVVLLLLRYRLSGGKFN